ncbi:MAG: PadR family transcriptional regulator [Candidatus Micrarchaeota archaeon]|nr:PadR family transcriptional regulator [Candidatus Micrarchaeota archaeon]
MSDIEIKNVAKLFTVLLLSENGQHGYEIMKEVGKRTGRKVSPGQIYPFLRQLKAYHYVETKGRAERDKQTYYLTPEGRKFVTRLSDKFGDMFEIAIKPKLTMCAHCNCEIYRGGYKEKIGGRHLTFCCENCAKGYRAMNAR